MTAPLQRRLAHADADLDLVPMIDCIFLMLLFFMLCGRISMDDRPEQITVPPTKTAVISHDDWERAVINVRGYETGGVPTTAITIGQHHFTSVGRDDRGAYRRLRAVLDRMYERAPKYRDPAIAGLLLPRVQLEVRADGDADYLIIQRIAQVIADSIDTDTLLPNPVARDQRRPFTHIGFTTRDVDG
jgi:hypothetical protein